MHEYKTFDYGRGFNLSGQIHKFRVFDKNIVLDINSGSVFEVDDIVYELLDDKKCLESLKSR